LSLLLRRDYSEMQRHIVESKYEPGVFFINNEQWNLGSRYRPIRVLGSGSFSCVTLCQDTKAGVNVAMKRVKDVLSTPDQARRVLREVVIMRRCSHPNILRMYDAFVHESSTGACRMVGGRLISESLDVYIAMEPCIDGDLFALQGQLDRKTIVGLMHQLLSVLHYLHDHSIWHRDIKSANCLLQRDRSTGDLLLKVGDFGSARHAAPQGHDHPDTIARNWQPPTVTARSGGGGGGGRAGDAPPSTAAAALTQVVATPCYRAPEVVMSRGGYTSAVDIWSAGCIFAELLSRMDRAGNVIPQLKVPPLFAIYGELGMYQPRAPLAGERFEENDSNDLMHRELEALFSVIGTPAWACIECITDPNWRTYLRHLTGRSSKLYSRFSFAGDAACDLLSRLLAFDPDRRCSAQEALRHEFFESLPMFNSTLPRPHSSSSSPIAHKQQDCEEMHPVPPPFPCTTGIFRPDVASPSMRSPVYKMPRLVQDLGNLHAGDRIGVGNTPDLSGLSLGDMAIDKVPAGTNYWEAADPAVAIRLLEREIEEHLVDTGHLRDLLTREIEELHQQRDQEVVAARGEGGPAGGRKNERDSGNWKMRGGLVEDQRDKMGVDEVGVGRTMGRDRLGAENHLEEGRHREWAIQHGGTAVADEPCWGVTNIDPAGLRMDGQQKR